MGNDIAHSRKEGLSWTRSEGCNSPISNPRRASRRLTRDESTSKEASICTDPLSFHSDATGVGNHKHSFTKVDGTKGSSRYAVPNRVVPAIGQVSENSSKSPVKQSWNVFHEHVSGSKVANDSSELRPQAAPLAIEAGVVGIGGADVLTGEPAGDEIDSMFI